MSPGPEHAPAEASNSRYGKGCRCAPCTDAHRVYAVERRHLLAQGRVWRQGNWFHPDARHGTSTGYTHFSCRCAPCREAFRSYLVCPGTNWRMS